MRRQHSPRSGSRWSVSAPCRETALHLASRNGHTESVKALLEKGADVNAASNNYLKCAISWLPVLHGRRLHAPAKAARRFGSWPSEAAPCRHTALHHASRNGHTESVMALLEKGADVNAASRDKCAFPGCLCCMGDGCTHRQRPCAVRLVVERVGAMQGDGAAPRILQRPHGEREGAAREGRGRERREQRQVGVCLFAVLHWRWLQAPAKAVRHSTRGGACRRHAGRRHCTSHLPTAARRA